MGSCLAPFLPPRPPRPPRTIWGLSYVPSNSCPWNKSRTHFLTGPWPEIVQRFKDIPALPNAPQLIVVLNKTFLQMHPERRPGMSDVHSLCGSSGLSFDSPFLSPLFFLSFFLFFFFCLVLLYFLSCHFSANGPFSWLFFLSKNLSNIFVKSWAFLYGSCWAARWR